MAPIAQEISNAPSDAAGGPLKSTPAQSNQDFTLEYIKTLTNVADVQECLRQLELEETQIDSDLDELLAERETLEASLDKLEVLE